MFDTEYPAPSGPVTNPYTDPKILGTNPTRERRTPEQRSVTYSELIGLGGPLVEIKVAFSPAAIPVSERAVAAFDKALKASMDAMAFGMAAVAAGHYVTLTDKIPDMAVEIGNSGLSGKVIKNVEDLLGGCLSANAATNLIAEKMTKGEAPDNHDPLSSPVWVPASDDPRWAQNSGTPEAQRTPTVRVTDPNGLSYFTKGRVYVVRGWTPGGLPMVTDDIGRDDTLIYTRFETVTS